jgi:hypothetical protein
MIGTRVYCKLTDAHTGCPKNGVLTVHYGKRQKNVKKILLDLFADLAALKMAVHKSIISKYIY